MSVFRTSKYWWAFGCKHYYHNESKNKAKVLLKNAGKPFFKIHFQIDENIKLYIGYSLLQQSVLFTTLSDINTLGNKTRCP